MPSLGGREKCGVANYDMQELRRESSSHILEKREKTERGQTKKLIKFMFLVFLFGLFVEEANIKEK